MRQNASDLICRYVYKSVSYMIAIIFYKGNTFISYCQILQNFGLTLLYGVWESKRHKKSSQRLANYLIFSGPTWA